MNRKTSKLLNNSVRKKNIAKRETDLDENLKQNKKDIDEFMIEAQFYIRDSILELMEGTDSTKVRRECNKLLKYYKRLVQESYHTGLFDINICQKLLENVP